MKVVKELRVRSKRQSREMNPDYRAEHVDLPSSLLYCIFTQYQQVENDKAMQSLSSGLSFHNLTLSVWLCQLALDVLVLFIQWYFDTRFQQWRGPFIFVGFRLNLLIAGI